MESDDREDENKSKQDYSIIEIIVHPGDHPLIFLIPSEMMTSKERDVLFQFQFLSSICNPFVTTPFFDGLYLKKLLEVIWKPFQITREQLYVNQHYSDNNLSNCYLYLDLYKKNNIKSFFRAERRK